MKIKTGIPNPTDHSRFQSLIKYGVNANNSKTADMSTRLNTDSVWLSPLTQFLNFQNKLFISEFSKILKFFGIIFFKVKSFFKIFNGF